ncbi:tetratricopeptide repeat protein [Luteibaculum oceani]|uniref:Tetratricopeptide repeat protein n=1 Tax=Luteibaculum oceani TaxID=1294296 RepID=A0A5C6UUC1_9FLAO|nr:tetratricopeptide repeat protein [Luteibaculum oceani]TXC76973.1 tetratricopeptide repeat protein [Luteibaculum oceani]
MRIVGFLCVLVLAVSCTSVEPKASDAYSEEQIVDSLKAGHAKLEQDLPPAQIISQSKSQVKFAELLLEKNPNTVKLEKWLFEGGKAGRTAGEFEKAIKLFDAYLERYPKGEKSAEIIFLKGFIYDEDLKNKEKARENYQRLLDEFPKHDLADDAEALITQLYMTPEEILQMLEEKSQQPE